MLTVVSCLLLAPGAQMQGSNRPPPKFSSFKPPTVDPPPSEAGPSRPRADPDDRDASRSHKRRRHDSLHDYTERASHSRSHRDASYRKDRDGRDRDTSHSEHSRPRRRDELRAMDKIASRPTAAQLNDRTRRPAQFHLDDPDISYYEDPYGATGSLYLEVKYLPPRQIRQVLGVPSIIRISRDPKKNTFEAFVPFHIKVSIYVPITHFFSTNGPSCNQLPIEQKGYQSTVQGCRASENAPPPTLRYASLEG
ncbi:hypothetical protein DL93DRAFT_552199 [Clavulina sp. PMI_390]|nr:hypothetical protein DL93DRAFT_552199 [Clavulina sp. PMI_390]